MKRINVGCGHDLKDGWINVDNMDWGQPKEYIIDILTEWNYTNVDYILVNHTLCLFDYAQADFLLRQFYDSLKPDGIIEIIDMDVMKAYESWQNLDFDGLPGNSDNIDERLCNHLVGYGRKSTYTPYLVALKLSRAGFTDIDILHTSPHGLRPKEDLTVKARKAYVY